MHGQSGTAQKLAKNVTAKPCSERRKGLRLNSQVMQISRGLFPLKTSQHLADITGYSVRSCEYWLSEKSVLPADALAALMQSEWGRDFLAAVMTDCTPRWWLKLKAWIQAVDLAAAERKHRRKLRELLDDANQAPGAAALLLQDEDFYSGQPHPVRALAKGRR